MTKKLTHEQYETLERVAYKTRAWAEKKAPSLGIMPTLERMCAIASGELWKRLKRAGLKPRIVFVHNHTFVKCGQWVVDITATQFSNEFYEKEYQPVEIVDEDLAAEDHVWGAKVRCDTPFIGVALRYQREQGWPEDQHIKLR